MSDSNSSYDFVPYKKLILMIFLLISVLVVGIHDQANRETFSEPFLDTSVQLDNSSIVLHINAKQLFDNNKMEVRLHLDPNQNNDFIIFTESVDYYEYNHSIFIHLTENMQSFEFSLQTYGVYIFSYNESITENSSNSLRMQYFDTEPVFIVDPTTDQIYHNYQIPLLVYFIIFSVSLAMIFNIQLIIQGSIRKKKNNKTKYSNEDEDEEIVIQPIQVLVYTLLFLIINKQIIEPRIFSFDFTNPYLVYSLPFISLIIVFLVSIIVVNILFQDNDNRFKLKELGVNMVLSWSLALLTLFPYVFFVLILLPLVLYLYANYKASKHANSRESLFIFLHLLVSQFLFIYTIQYSPKIEEVKGLQYLLFFVTLIYFVISVFLYFMSTFQEGKERNLFAPLLVMFLFNLLLYLILSFGGEQNLRPILIG